MRPAIVSCFYLFRGDMLHIPLLHSASSGREFALNRASECKTSHGAGRPQAISLCLFEEVIPERTGHAIVPDGANFSRFHRGLWQYAEIGKPEPTEFCLYPDTEVFLILHKVINDDSDKYVPA